MTTSARRLLAALFLTVTSACRSATGVPEAGVSARPSIDGIVLTNTADVPASYHALSLDLAVRSLLIACADENDPCPRVPAQSTITVAWSEVGGYRPGVPTSYRVLWSLVRHREIMGRSDVIYPGESP